jgi:hypothetical protein
MSTLPDIRSKSWQEEATCQELEYTHYLKNPFTIKRNRVRTNFPNSLLEYNWCRNIQGFLVNKQWTINETKELLKQKKYQNTLEKRMKVTIEPKKDDLKRIIDGAWRQEYLIIHKKRIEDTLKKIDNKPLSLYENYIYNKLSDTVTPFPNKY